MTWKVVCIESERGWGRKIDDVKVFATQEEALAFQRRVNANNPPFVNGRAPDYYYQAEDPYEVSQ